MLKGFIFDLDGVIVDTAKYHYLAWKEIASELNIPFGIEENEKLKGISRKASFEIILSLGNKMIDDDEIETWLDKKNGIYLSYIGKLTEAEILPGVKEFLNSAKEKGYFIILGSASKNARFILKKLNLIDCFDVIVDGTVVKKAKPDPEVFIKGAELSELEYSQCVVFEDSIAGIEAAHSAGMFSVGIGDKETLNIADTVITSFEKINVQDVEISYNTTFPKELKDD